ncbi:D-2-hydroxyacid dehydrogenase [Pseudomonadota bacterium]
MNRLLILAADVAKYTVLIKAANLPQLEIQAASDQVSAELSIDGCNIILGDPPLVSKVLASARALEWVQSSWAGVDELCRPDLRRDYVLTGAKDIFGPLISEYVMTYLFAIERRLFTMRINQLKRSWKPLSYRSSKQITLGIVGLGSIGAHLARTARQFGIRVIGLNRSGHPCKNVEKVYTSDDPAGFFKEPDYIVLTLPDTPQTRHFINADNLSLMKPSAVLMNVGRGSLINEADLLTALREDVIAGAVLDVFQNEPLVQDSPLWQLPNVYITPHTAAMSFAQDIVEIFIDNYKRFIQKQPLSYIIDFDLGY